MKSENLQGGLASVEFDCGRPGLLWSCWLRMAAVDGPGLRRWQAWIWWTRQRGLRSRLSAGLRVIRGLVEAPFEAWSGVRRFGEKTANVHHVGYMAQYRHLLLLRWRYGVRPESYYKFQMFRNERIDLAHQYVEECGQLLQAVLTKSPWAEDAVIFLSKAKFRQWCDGRGLPSVGSVLELEDGEVVCRAHASLPEVDLFVKPANWSGGKGASLWRCISVGGRPMYVNNEGRRQSAEEFEAHVCRTSAEQGRPYIVQRAMTNHPLLKTYTNGALATLRLMTVRHPGERAEALMAALRMPTGDAIADNFDLGGVAAAVDLETGACAIGVRKKGRYPMDGVSEHPDTHQPIAGLVIPQWEECVALVCAAHELIEAQVPVVGWDIAVLEDGPVLVEANRLPCGNLAQMPGGLPLGASKFAEVIVRRLRAAYLS